jgi:hypothetical protein
MKAWTKQAIIAGMGIQVSLALNTKDRIHFYCLPKTPYVNKATRTDWVFDACPKTNHYYITETVMFSQTATTETHTTHAICKTTSEGSRLLPKTG